MNPPSYPCSKCRKLLEKECFHINKWGQLFRGYKTTCNTCRGRELDSKRENKEERERKAAKRNQKNPLKWGQCTYCRAFGPITRDHVFPKCLGGTGFNNIVPCCHECNREKGNKTINQWFNVMKPNDLRKSHVLPFLVEV